MASAMLTKEFDVWILLERLWRNPELVGVGSRDQKKILTPAIVPAQGREPCFGLCQSLYRLYSNHQVVLSVYVAAKKRLEDHLRAIERQSGRSLGSPDQKWAYLFDLDMLGAKQRAALCEKFASASRGAA